MISIGVGLAIPFPLMAIGSQLPDKIQPIFYFPHLLMCFAVHAIGAPESIVSTGGHIPWLTSTGNIIVYIAPAVTFIPLGLVLRHRASKHARGA